MIKNRPRRAGAAWIKYEEDKRYEPHGDKGSDRVSILVCHVRESAPELAVLLLLPTCAQAHHSLSSSPEGKDAPPFVARCSGRMRLCCGPRMYSYSLSTASGYKRVLPSSQGGSEKALAHRRGG